MKRPSVIKIVAGVLLAFPVWIAGTLGAFVLSSKLSVEDAAHVGTAGDIFGSSSSLFGALSVLGLIYVLWYERADHIESIRPYLIPDTKLGNLRILRAWSDGSTTDFSLMFSFMVRNISDQSALNLDVDANKPKDASEVKCDVTIEDLPLAPADERLAVVRYTLTGSEAVSFIRHLADGNSSAIDVEIVYEGLNGAKWCSKVKFSIAMKDPTGRLEMSRVLNGDASFEITGKTGQYGADEDLQFEVHADKGSWKQEPR